MTALRSLVRLQWYSSFAGACLVAPDITVDGSSAGYAAQETLALTEDQMASICAEYATMSDALNAVYAEQKAMLSTTVEVGSQVLMTGQVSVNQRPLSASTAAFPVQQRMPRYHHTAGLLGLSLCNSAVWITLHPSTGSLRFVCEACFIALRLAWAERMRTSASMMYMLHVHAAAGAAVGQQQAAVRAAGVRRGVQPAHPQPWTVCGRHGGRGAALDECCHPRRGCW